VANAVVGDSLFGILAQARMRSFFLYHPSFQPSSGLLEHLPLNSYPHSNVFFYRSY